MKQLFSNAGKPAAQDCDEWEKGNKWDEPGDCPSMLLEAVSRLPPGKRNQNKVQQSHWVRRENGVRQAQRTHILQVRSLDRGICTENEPIEGSLKNCRWVLICAWRGKNPQGWGKTLESSGLNNSQSSHSPGIAFPSGRVLRKLGIRTPPY